MSDISGRIIPVPIEDEIKDSYLTYAMSVIVSRALPDARDGLKPVHRRILYAMSEMGLHYDRDLKKCGRIVGDVLGKYHPHGDQSIYDALVRLAQNFSMRYTLVRGQGNFGSVDGDPPAAMRYTEAKMEKISEEILRDIKKETVDFGPNYDDSLKEPLVLPTALPNLLINGTSGIAVGMATNMAPHNLKEVCSAIIAYISNPEVELKDLMKHVTGPDFPTGGIILGRKGIKEAYHTGKGKVTVRSKFTVEVTDSGKERIIVSEIPYMVNKANLLIRIAELVKDKKIDGISDLRDESDRDGMRIVIELKRGVITKVILNQLFSLTSLQQNFNMNNLALVKGVPRLLSLKEQIEIFVKHRKEVVIRRSKYDLRKAEERAHILEGLKIALENIDEVIKIIKESENVETAREGLMKSFGLSERQAQAILDMRLQKITSLETRKIVEELEEVTALIKYLKELLASDEKILALISKETEEISEKYGDVRKTEIVSEEAEEIDVEDMIQKEDMVVLISNKGFIKRIPVSSYKNQARGGKGISSAKLKNEDFIEHLFVASTHDYILFITSEGKAFWLKVHEIPESSKTSRGIMVRTLFAISPNEDINAIVALKEFSEESFIFMGTKRGLVKKVTTSAFSNAKTRGIRAIEFNQGDSLVNAILTKGECDIMLMTRRGNALRYNEKNIRASGRTSKGVTGIKLKPEDEVTGFLSITEEDKILIITEKGYGKRIDYNLFQPHGTRTRGQIAYKTTEKTGEIIGVISVGENDQLMCSSSQGTTIKIKVDEISIQGKTAGGVKVVNITPPDFLVSIAKVSNDDDSDEE
ncbi:MAG: DNA topoisomerase (ATP-hydrolyzing) subunit A [Spirochaetaceae bacterium]|nr:DNA topoisomerase (ATP-hydrolyzing) subunit A [Spirochaetaceae bacterium]